MDKKSKLLVTVFAIAVAASVIATFYRYIMREDISYSLDEEVFQASLLEE